MGKAHHTEPRKCVFFVCSACTHWSHKEHDIAPQWLEVLAIVALASLVNRVDLVRQRTPVAMAAADPQMPRPTPQRPRSLTGGWTGIRLGVFFSKFIICNTHTHTLHSLHIILCCYVFSWPLSTVSISLSMVCLVHLWNMFCGVKM